METSVQTVRDGRYALVRVLGEGGQATTFEAVDKQNGRLVVVKRFRVHGAKSWKDVELAEREAAVLASLTHASLPRYGEHFEENGELFLVMDKIEGDSLAELQKRGERMGQADVVRFLRETSAALDYLHGRAPPIIHRDIKPSNVIRRPDGSFALIDFGSVSNKLRQQGGSTVVGTFGYMAPEQFQGRAMPASDVYGAAATAVALLTGVEPERLPHQGLRIDVDAALRHAKVDPDLRGALAAMLEPNPDERPSSIAAILKPPVPKQSTRASAEPSRRDEGPSRADSHRARRERRREERERRREERHFKRGFAGRRRDRNALPGLILAIVLAGLTIARIAVMVSLRALVPTLLTLLSIVFGTRLKASARNVARFGALADDALGRARDRVRRSEERLQGVSNEWRPPAPDDTRVRVEDDRRVRVDYDSAIDAEFEDEPQPKAARRHG